MLAKSDKELKENSTDMAELDAADEQLIDATSKLWFKM